MCFLNNLIYFDILVVTRLNNMSLFNLCDIRIFFFPFHLRQSLRFIYIMPAYSFSTPQQLCIVFLLITVNKFQHIMQSKFVAYHFHFTFQVLQERFQSENKYFYAAFTFQADLQHSPVKARETNFRGENHKVKALVCL